MTAPIYETIPNVSEGRDLRTLDACAEAIERSGALLAHRTSDRIHNRTVFTVFGTQPQLVRAAVALAGVALERIDLRDHDGAHPRIGALDVLPFVPVRDATLEGAIELAHAAAHAIWDAHRIPSIFYGSAAMREGRALLSDVRRGQFEGLEARAERGEQPDVGTALFHESAGTIAIAAREILIAFNVELATSDLAVAREIARELRERNGGLRTLRVLGIALDRKAVQVSCNLTDAKVIPIDRLVDLIRRAASRRGVAVRRSELIGLVPRAALASVVARAFECELSEVLPPPEGRRDAAQ
jgi:glutamate formiminotransferase